MVCIYVRDSREIDSRKHVLADREVAAVRHVFIYNVSQGIGIWRPGSRSIQIHHFLITLSGLEHQCRSPCTSCLDIYDQTDIIKYMVVAIPDIFHSLHAGFLAISEEHLYTLAP